MKKDDVVNSPSHYVQAGALLEPIDVIRDCPFDLGNAIKYVCRAGHKNDELEDLLKAKRYVQWAKESFVLNNEPYEAFARTKILFLRKLSPFKNLDLCRAYGVICHIERIVDSRIKKLKDARKANK